MNEETTTMPDLDDLTDEQLDQMRRDVLTEQERRQRIAQMPDELRAMAAAAAAAGISDEQVRAAVEDGLTKESP